MTVTGYFFSLKSTERFELLTQEEQDGIFCLLDRARQYGGKNDILFLCLSNCSLLIQFAPDAKGVLQIFGFAFQKQEEPWLWVWLPVLIGTVPDAIQLRKNIYMKPERADAMAAWSKKHHPFLWNSTQQFGQDAIRQMKAYSIGFTQLAPSLYGDKNIQWYRIHTSEQSGGENIQTVSQSDMDACLERYQTEDDIYITPPRLLGSWHAVQGDKKAKLGTVSPVSDWYSFAEHIRKEIL